ncbi:hypothetical protein GNI_019680 [Gregarina niphandrodes]|uniref:Uncharacterized protein n=1 Tax=Gregarina niphandrodes TaxID=110365 RepID=A0A023BC34_GRENI|nr:hypothetical protein GNI_019680 [Gregarina niphandrodes]EZG81192.1 hypothetical protein GNI_019680 [Gregarina niphandrodes]|eukprot:XP_011134250.1 hypothetical protein GNI_019680 [Gregarina niphandrodes]
MISFQLLKVNKGQMYAEVSSLDEMGRMIRVVYNEITTLRMVRESYRKSANMGEVQEGYLRRTAAEAVTAAVRKLIAQVSSSGDWGAKSLKRFIHALQMYAQPELRNPLAEDVDDEFWAEQDIRRRNQELDRLQRKAREILIRLESFVD